MTWTDFYKGHWGDLFGATAGRPNPHRGVDAQWPAGTPVPSYVAGTVVAVVRNSVVGWYVVVQVGSRFVGYCHLRQGSTLTVGAKVRPGTIVGQLAGAGDFHGTAWTGPHCHITETSRALPASGPWFDPMPRIKTAIATDTPADDEDEEDEMTIKIEKAYDGKFYACGQTIPGGWRQLKNEDEAIGYSRAGANGRDSIGSGITGPVQLQSWKDAAAQLAKDYIATQVKVNATVNVDAAVIAKAIFDEQAKRLAS